MAISSVRIRERANTMVFTPAFRRRVAIRWLSRTTLRRMPCTRSTRGGLYSTKCRSPDGAEQTLVYYDAADKKLKIDVTRAGLGEGPKNVEAGPFELKPGEMCLGKTVEKVTLAPNIIGKLEGRSRYARMGLIIHITAAVVQPGSDNHQVLEIVNNSKYDYVIHEGMRITHIVFARTQTKTSKPYRKFGDIARRQ